MAGEHYDDDGDLCSFFEEPMVEPSMETLLGAEPQQVPSTDHVHIQLPHPVSSPHLQHVHQAASMIHVQHPPQPPVMPLEYQQAPSIDLQYPQPPAVPVHHQQMTGESSAAMPVHQQQMLGEWPAAMPVQHQQMLGEWPAAIPLQHQQMLGESPSAMPLEHQHMLQMLDELSPAMPLQDQQTALHRIFFEHGDYYLSSLFTDMEKEENLAGRSGSGNPDVSPMADHEIGFVQFVPGQLLCDNCYVVREVRHQSESRVRFFSVHAAADGTFTHAIVDHNYTGADGQPSRGERMYINLRGRTREWVRHFVANSVETLRNEAGTLENVFDALGAVAASSRTTNDAPPPASDPPHRELEFDMLRKIFSTAAVNSAPVGPAPPAPLVNLWHGPPAEILESVRVAQEGQPNPSNATLYPSLITRRQRARGPANVSTEEEETRQYVHAAKEEAEREQSAPSAMLKKFCRGNPSYSHKLRRIRDINKKIVNLDRAAHKVVGSSALSSIRRLVDALVAEKRNMYAVLTKGMNEEREKKEKENGCSFPPGKNDDEASPSGGACRS